MVNLDVSLDVIKKVSTGTAVLQVIGLLLAVFRFWFRYRIQRLWWEDAWAFAAFLFAISYLAGSWLYVHYGKPIATVGSWMSTFAFNPVIWLVRHSTILSVARIIYPSMTLRRMVLGIGLGFFLLFITFMAAKLWFYFHDLSWMNDTLFYGNPLLPLSTKLVIFELTIDFLADAILIALPIKLLWSVKLPTRQRRMILLIFASGIMVTLAAICHTTCQLLGLHSIVILAMDVEVALSSIMCNLLVFVTSLYRYGRSGSLSPSTDSEEDDDYTTPVRPRQTSQLLTTIEVGNLEYSSENGTSTWSDGCTSDATSAISGTRSSLEE
ncbi:hypothetical protein F5J12DRAFT_364015 [Pisolithus orientalis]|uniref:uncharacterized protein n=1 Tax=Pisolithus orientalis TaxID=936130 RepID=UPI002224CBE1|nr:uncharacterized protein F5J12DRAFT_364015 [Pisolithus orientalis]KAI5996021.1 hypothetical protein F5J12DRAFT_364015 [Pisolithus orientalis]